ncbi:hypothetical protein [Sphingomonas sp.]|uniref:hypothetical protein n=1 Tax=Sphingomonas sp. TaxID=28214 RepID=UPI001ED6F956|nr:hypothetical protein [Sphingomonas sp.]MBX3594805.1 hypothetical protein [Sphingomonas sp.]
MTTREWKHCLVGGAGAMAVLFTIWIWPRTAEDAPAPGTVRVAPTASIDAAPTPMPKPAAVVPPGSLIGTWSRRDNRGDPQAGCDLFSAVSYLSNGQYLANTERGRYAIDARSITYSEQVLYDVDGGEDLSQANRRVTRAVEWPGAHHVRIGTQHFYRCEKANS